MGRKDEQLARSLLSDYDWLRRVDGIFILSQGRLCIASRPDRKNWDLKSVYRFLLSDTFSDNEIKEVLKVRDLVPIDVSFLARWQYHEKRLSIPGFEKLIKSGVGPVKNLKNTQWKKRIAFLKERFELLKTLFHNTQFRTFVLQPRAHSEIDNSFLFQQINFLFGTEKAELSVKHFPQRIDFTMLWSYISPVLKEKDASLQLEEILVENGFSSHGFRRKINKTLMRDASDISSQIREIIREIVQRKNSKPEDYLGEVPVRLVVSSLVFGADARAISHLDGWEFDRVLDYEDSQRMRSVLAATVELKLSSGTLCELAASELHKNELSIGAGVADRLSDFNSKRALKRYVNVVRQYPNLSIAHQSWFTNLFNSEKDWVGSLALALVAPRKDYQPTQLFSITSTIFQDKIPEVEEGIRLWDQPSLEKRPEGWEDVADALNISNSAIDAYLYYRKLLGEEFTFSNAIMEPLKLLENEEKQKIYLRKKLENEPENVKLIKALAFLENAAGRETRIHLAKENAVKTFERSVAKMKSESFEIVLSNIATMVLRKRYNFKIDKPLSTDFLNAFHLLSAEEIDVVLLQRFFRSAIAGDDISDWPENVCYLKQADFNVKIWKAGFDIKVGDFRIHTESNPLEALKMGGYFDTCLRLEGGMNAFSALVNVTDVNKHVVYARSKSGAVVARQLIAVSEKEGLLGYHTYMQSESRPALAQNFLNTIQKFASLCGLPLVDEGEPEAVTSENWYNDGAQSWTGQVDDEDDDYWERVYVGASLGGHRAKLERVAEDGEWPWKNFAAYDLRGDFGDDVNIFQGGGISRVGRYLTEPWDTAARTIDDLIAFRGVLATDSFDWDVALCSISLSFSSVSPTKLVRALEKYWDLCDAVPLFCISESHPNCLRDFEDCWVQLFLVSYLEGHDISSVEKLLSHRAQSVRNIALGVFSFVTASSATKFRQLLKRATLIEEKEILVKCLTLCGDARDTLTFKKFFLETPTSAVFAYAILNAGLSKEVRRFWIADIEESSSESFAIGRSLGVLPTFDALLKQIRNTSDLEFKESLMEKWIQYGQPVDLLNDVAKPLLKLAENIALGREKNIYFEGGKYNVAFEPGAAFSLLRNIVDSDVATLKRASLFAILERETFLNIAAYLSRGRVEYTWDEVKKATSKTSYETRLYLTPASNFQINSQLTCARSLLTQDPKELTVLYNLRDHLIKTDDYPGLLLLMEIVCNKVPAKMAEGFMAGSFKRIDFNRWNWKESQTDLGGTIRILRALRHYVSIISAESDT